VFDASFGNIQGACCTDDAIFGVSVLAAVCHELQSKTI
jgi:hypothetical protein